MDLDNEIKLVKKQMELLQLELYELETTKLMDSPFGQLVIELVDENNLEYYFTNKGINLPCTEENEERLNNFIKQIYINPSSYCPSDTVHIRMSIF